MKKLISLIVLVFMLSGILASCDLLPELPFYEPKVESPDNPETPETPETPDTPDTPETPETPEKKPEEKPEEKPEAPETPETPEEKPEEPKLPPVGTSVGYLFRDMTLKTLEGETINTADLRGKIIVFNVWATWCPPCKAELPDFNELASEYDGEVVFIAVHCYDNAMYNMPSYVAENFPDTKIIFAYDTPNSDAYIAAGGVGYVPQTAIIDRNGVILYSDSGMLSKSVLEGYFNK